MQIVTLFSIIRSKVSPVDNMLSDLHVCLLRSPVNTDFDNIGEIANLSIARMKSLRKLEDI